MSVSRRDDLTPYHPGPDGPFGFLEAAHLLARAELGAPFAEIEALITAGRGR